MVESGLQEQPIIGLEQIEIQTLCEVPGDHPNVIPRGFFYGNGPRPPLEPVEGQAASCLTAVSQDFAGLGEIIRICLTTGKSRKFVPD